MIPRVSFSAFSPCAGEVVLEGPKGAFALTPWEAVELARQLSAAAADARPVALPKAGSFYTPSLVVPVDGEPFTCHVLSRTPGQPSHYVDLALWAANGECDCAHWQFRLWPKIRDGAKPDPRLRCFHIKTARQFYITAMLIAYVRQQKQKQSLEMATAAQEAAAAFAQAD